MTKKHYVSLADTLYRWRKEYKSSMVAYCALVDELCVILKRDNARFDVTRFRNATDYNGDLLNGK